MALGHGFCRKMESGPGQESFDKKLKIPLDKKICNGKY
jgi:hypothetical protein